GYVEYEETRQNRSGQPLFVLTQKFAIQQSGNPPLIGQIMTDLTERNRALRQIRELNTTLEEKVRERTAELEATNAEFQAFTFSVSHDLRSPLRSLDGFAELLSEKYSSVLDEQGLHYLSRISHASMKMADLINDLLSLSKISGAKMKIEQVDIGSIANSIISEYIRKEPDRIVSISIKPSMMASCDAFLVHSLLRTLIDNAFKFSKGTARTVIEVGSTRTDPAHPGAMVYYLKDNGVGFDMAYKDTLFQPFHRLHDVTEFPGNGIGLAIAKLIVDRHGGAIWLESEPGKGTTASFILSPGLS
ncbi:MAG TPA: ATP-binding protein, partial [Rectinemataceae bacterium]|nr:ATP-binding protein [Rectinemataceae bacterium]